MRTGKISPVPKSGRPARGDDLSEAASEPLTPEARPLRLADEEVLGSDIPAGEPSGPPVSQADLPMLLLALLLAAPDATPVSELARAADVSIAAVEAALAELDVLSRGGDSSAWVIQRHGATVQLATAPRFAPYVRRFLGLDREAKLSPAAIETLAIIAYQQPVTRAEIDAVRGVDSSGVLATLHSRGLIEQVGRVQAPGNPVQYGTTARFLQHFGLASLADLPSLGQVEGRDAHLILQEATMVKRDEVDHDDSPVIPSGDRDRAR